MGKYISDEVRSFIAHRVSHRCEYCRVYARHSFLSFHIEHIISIKHGGTSDPENLAYACPICNIKKGSDIATFIDESDVPVRFFNPRKDGWEDHFWVEPTGLMVARTDIGDATIKILDLNHPDSVIERKAMIKKGLF